MGKKNLLLYTEVDPNSHYTVTADRVTVANQLRNEDAWVIFDYGTGYLSGNFRQDFTVRVDSATAANAWHINDSWANVIDDFNAFRSNNEHLIANLNHAQSETVLRIFAFEFHGNTQYLSGYGGAFDTIYYLTARRDMAIGVYGTYYVYIYSDEARENLLSVRSVALKASTAFRYNYATQSYNDGAASFPLYAYMENLDFKEEVGSRRRRMLLRGN